ncbi:MAG TPA: 6,7-dimethyl-8-ribityllumazine synthase [Thermoanaerobaculia bacterium]|nr:6,7-dimethyl-8-ribityllumazine synthase [Thermoanaerobaculia bacterium]
MSNLRPRERPLDGAGRRVAVIASRYNGEVVDRLVEGALRALESRGVERSAIRLEQVPGAWEIPLALEAIARRGDVDLAIALGAVIRGDTSHYEFVAGECSRGVAEISLRHLLPIGFGVLTCETLAQALDRAGGASGNKGEEAALAALEMADALDRLGS